MLRLLSLATRGGLHTGAEGYRLGLTAAATRLTSLQEQYCTTTDSDGKSSDAAGPPEQMGNPGPQPRPVHSCGQAYRPNILRYMKHMGFKRQPTIPPTFMVPEGTPSNEKVAAVIRQVEQAHHQLFGKLPGPPPRPDLVEKYLAPENASLTEKREAELQRIMGVYQRFEGDTGSSEVQVALLTTRISQLAEHLKVHKKDHSSRHGLEAALNKRRKLLAYLRRTDFSAYANLISSLGLRDNYQKLDRLTLQIQQRRLRGPSKKKNKRKRRR